ncbi:proline-rich receptor-like protein kinase PERK8 [Phragmites australis]|uniref:proline-rich receptor-like protein kinase PERK8 n=1 Tax=Phragmites australis TaxID=29695 RepID=UPI002D781D70|nr:proline-rich receptor-like protein kinase PERK8 [Phragmites australis]
MPRVLMASDEHLASAPKGGPPTPPPPPEFSAPPPPKASSSSPPPPTPSPPVAHSPPPPATPSPPPPAPSGHNNSPTSPFEQSLAKTPGQSAASHPPETSPTASPPPPASPPPTSRSPPPPSPSKSPPSPPPPATSSPPSPTALTPPSHQSAPESTSPPASPPPSSSEKPAPANPTASPLPNAASASTPPAGAGTPPPPHETPTPGTPPATAAQAPPAPGTPASATQILPPPMALTVIMPASGPRAGTWRSPTDPTAIAPPLAPPAGGNVKTEVLIGLSVAGLLLALASLFIFVCLNNRGRKRHAQPPRKNNIVVPERQVHAGVILPAGPAPSPSGTNSYDFSCSKSWFTYDELVGITGGFSSGNVIGEGGFGKVYMGALGDGRRVAVKQLKVGSGQGEKEFRAEVDIISRIHHRHLVTLVGYCVTENHRLLVYEFVPNKTLEHHLHEKGLPVMDWPKRMKIAIGAARGLTYLHEDCHPRIIHRDIKSANILLDDAFEAKVADFGLAKLTNDSLTHISTRVMGTFGYMAPEYASSGKLTDRSDVFSFGVVLLELITGRKPVDSSQPLGEESLVEWARLLLVDALETDDFREIADPALECRYSKTEMRRMVEAAAACVRHSAAKRPRMVQVWRSLDVDESSDLTNGVKLGQSTAYDSSRHSADIELFRRMAFANDLSTAEFGLSDEDDHHSSAGPSSQYTWTLADPSQSSYPSQEDELGPDLPYDLVRDFVRGTPDYNVL